MSTITTRSGKGSPLTNNEVDTNFTNLNTDKLESADLAGYATLSGATFTGEVEATGFNGDLTGAILFKGQAGEALTKGDPVYISGISGNKTVVSKADANDANKMPCFGIVDATVSANADCSVVTFGTLQGLDTSSFSEGDELFVSDTGTLTTTAPTGESSQIQKIGKVTRSHASAGSIKVMGAGRTNAVPNLNDGQFFLGNGSNQAVSTDFTTSVLGEISAGTGIGISGSGVISNSAPDQTVSLTGAGTTTVSGTYPNFTITGAGTTYTAGSGLSLTGTEFANTAPDQTVTLTGAGTTTVSGTYPNFTITGSGGTYTAGTGITLTGTEFSIGQDVATTASPTFAAINVNGLVTSDDFQIDLGTATASAQITTPSALGGFQALSIKNTSTEGYLSFGTTLGQARIQATGANGSADPLDIDVGGITAIGIADDGAVTMGGDVTLDAGLTGDAILTIRADSDNNNEGDHPSIRFKQDSDLVDWRIGIGSTDSDTGTYNNDFCITHNAGSTNGLKYVTAGGNLVHTIWHSGNDGAGSGLDADLLDGIDSGSFLRSDATDTTTGYLTVDNHFRVANPSAVQGQGDNHTHLNYNNTGVNYIRGTTTVVSSPNLDCQYLRADRIYSNNDGSTGYFYNDSGTRTAYTGGDFYIQSSVANCYIYATNTYLGNTSGDTIRFRGNTVTHNGWTADSSGHFRMNDNKYFRLGSGSDVEHFWSGSHYYTDVNGGAWWYIRDGNSSNTHEFGFDIDTGNFHADGNIYAYSTSINSDIKLKDNVKEIENALDKIDAIRGVTWDWKRDGSEGAGVIAQEVEKVMPSAVTDAVDMNSDETQKAVDYNQIIGLLVQSVKELKAEVEELKGAK